MFNIGEIPKYLKNMLLNVLLMPFWYISIYLFAPEIYATQDVLLLLSICVSLTMISSIIAAILTNYNSDKKEPPMSPFDTINVIAAFLIQLILLSIILFISFLVPKFTGRIFEFYGFVLTYFLILSFSGLVIVYVEKKQ
ncbi:hypothetical protein [Maribacter flavus]|uniref:Uncharacterized protein n=1 Tax=Maribacter flavus TaxID=1658664 RepID=A0A5B2TUX6_9FLAO|nr:hypothetical protein [Maribacter flavus]KAA2218277.1 hypothetical protein F0361_01255 [Maribacter flavus]